MRELLKNKILKFTFFLLWFAILILSIYWGYGYLTGNVGFTPAQPVVFSHKVHSGDYGMKCMFCHYKTELASFSAVPTTYSCTVCHVALKNESLLMKMVNISADSNIPLKWTRVYALPDFSHFSHKAHIRVMIDCSSCHGEVEKMEKVMQSKALTMKWCLDCHRNPKEFIIPAREISGIFIYPSLDSVTENGKIKIVFSKYMIEPGYGAYLKELVKPYVKGIPMPKLPGRGPENCSACHY